MEKSITHMIDTKQALGAVGTLAGGLSGYLEVIQPLVGIFFTVVVGSLTAWYTWERASKLRKDRLKDDSKENK